MTDKQNPENSQSGKASAQKSAKETEPKETEPKETEKGSSSQRLLNVGRQLQNRRRALKLSIKQMSEQTRIRAEILKSMEANKFSEMSEPVYTRGFLRTYGDHLGLDGEELVQLLDKQNQLPEEKEISLPTPAEEGALPSRTWLLFSALALLIIGGAWYNVDTLRAGFTGTFVNKSDMQPNVAVPAPENGIDTEDASNTLPSPVFQTPQAVKFSNTEENIKKNAQIQTAQKEPPPQQEGKPDSVPEAPDGARIRLYAKDDVWLEVKPKGDEPPIFSKILTAQSSYWVPARDDLLLDVGLPPELVIFVDDQRMGKSGTIDRRVRDLPLKPAFLKESYFGQDMHLEPNIPEEENADTNRNQEPAPNTPPEPTGNDNVEDVVVEDEKVKIKGADEAE